MFIDKPIVFDLFSLCSKKLYKKNYKKLFDNVAKNDTVPFKQQKNGDKYD